MTVTGRPLTKVVITPEMIEAGADALCLFNLSEDRPEDIAHEVYRAMRLLEGRFAALRGKTLPTFADSLVPTECEDRADKQALAGQRAADTIVRVVQ